MEALRPAESAEGHDRDLLVSPPTSPVWPGFVRHLYALRDNRVEIDTLAIQQPDEA